MSLLLWIAAVILAIFGIVQILNGSILWGVVLLILAAGVGPGGWSFFNRRPTV